MSKDRWASVWDHLCAVFLAATYTLFAYGDDGGGSASEPPSLLSISYHGRSGLTNRAGKVIVEPKFRGLSGYDSSRSWNPSETARLDFSEGLRPAKLDRNWGFIDQQGEFVIPPRWSMAGPFRDGRAQVCEGELWGIIDKTGQYVVKPQYSYIGRFVEGRARVAVGGKHIEMGMPGGKWGFIDASGNTVVPPIYDFARDFQHGRALVNVNGRWGGGWGYDFQGGKWGVVDLAGQLVVEPTFEFEQRFPLRSDSPNDPVPLLSKEGLRAVTSNGKCGYVDAQWKMRIAPQFESAGDFSEGLAAVRRDGRFGYIDAKGRMIVEPRYKTAGPFSEGLAAVTVNGFLDYIDLQGQISFQIADAMGEPFRDGLAEVKVRERSGFVDRAGKWVCEPKFIQLCRLGDGLWSFYDGQEKYGLVDRRGRILLAPKYAWIGALQPDETYHAEYAIGPGAKLEARISRAGEVVNGVELFRFQPKESNGLWGIFDTQNDTFVIEPQFQQVQDLDRGILGVSRAGKWGIADLTTGKIVLEPTYWSIERFSEGLAAARAVEPGAGLNAKGYIDRNGKMLIPPQFNHAGEFHDGIAQVTIYHHDPYWQDVLYIDKTGRYLWHPETQELKSPGENRSVR